MTKFTQEQTKSIKANGQEILKALQALHDLKKDLSSVVAQSIKDNVTEFTVPAENGIQYKLTDNKNGKYTLAVNENAFEVEFDKDRMIVFSKKMDLNGKKFTLGGVGKIDLYHLHLENLEKMLKHLESNNADFAQLIAMATGSGKSFTQALWYTILNASNVKAVFSAPDKATNQLLKDFRSFVPDELVKDIKVPVAGDDITNGDYIVSHEDLMGTHFNALYEDAAIRYIGVDEVQNVVSERDVGRLELLAKKLPSVLLSATPSKLAYEEANNDAVVSFSLKDKLAQKNAKAPVILDRIDFSKNSKFSKFEHFLSGGKRDAVKDAILTMQTAIHLGGNDNVPEDKTSVSDEEIRAFLRWNLDKPTHNVRNLILTSNEIFAQVSDELTGRLTGRAEKPSKLLESSYEEALKNAQKDEYNQIIALLKAKFPKVDVVIFRDYLEKNICESTIRGVFACNDSYNINQRRKNYNELQAAKEKIVSDVANRSQIDKAEIEKYFNLQSDSALVDLLDMDNIAQLRAGKKEVAIDKLIWNFNGLVGVILNNNMSSRLPSIIADDKEIKRLYEKYKSVAYGDQETIIDSIKIRLNIIAREEFKRYLAIKDSESAEFEAKLYENNKDLKINQQSLTYKSIQKKISVFIKKTERDAHLPPSIGLDAYFAAKNKSDLAEQNSFLAGLRVAYNIAKENNDQARCELIAIHAKKRIGGNIKNYAEVDRYFNDSTDIYNLALEKAVYLATNSADRVTIEYPTFSNFQTQNEARVVNGLIDLTLSYLTGKDRLELNEMRRKQPEILEKLVQEKLVKLDLQKLKKDIETQYKFDNDKNKNGIPAETALEIADILYDNICNLKNNPENQKRFIDNWSFDKGLIKEFSGSRKVRNFTEKYANIFEKTTIDTKTSNKTAEFFSGYENRSVPYLIHGKLNPLLVDVELTKMQKLELKFSVDGEISVKLPVKFPVELSIAEAENLKKLGLVGSFVSDDKYSAHSDINNQNVVYIVDNAHSKSNNPENLIQGFGRNRGLDPNSTAFYLIVSKDGVEKSFEIKHLLEKDYFKEFFVSKEKFNEAVLIVIRAELFEVLTNKAQELMDFGGKFDDDKLQEACFEEILKCFRIIYNNNEHDLDKSRAQLQVLLKDVIHDMKHVEKAFRDRKKPDIEINFATAIADGLIRIGLFFNNIVPNFKSIQFQVVSYLKGETDTIDYAYLKVVNRYQIIDLEANKSLLNTNMQVIENKKKEAENYYGEKPKDADFFIKCANNFGPFLKSDVFKNNIKFFVNKLSEKEITNLFVMNAVNEKFTHIDLTADIDVEDLYEKVKSNATKDGVEMPLTLTYAMPEFSRKTLFDLNDKIILDYKNKNESKLKEAASLKAQKLKKFVEKLDDYSTLDLAAIIYNGEFGFVLKNLNELIEIQTDLVFHYHDAEYAKVAEENQPLNSRYKYNNQADGSVTPHNPLVRDKIYQNINHDLFPKMPDMDPSKAGEFSKKATMLLIAAKRAQVFFKNLVPNSKSVAAETVAFVTRNHEDLAELRVVNSYNFTDFDRNARSLENSFKLFQHSKRPVLANVTAYYKWENNFVEDLKPEAFKQNIKFIVGKLSEKDIETLFVKRGDKVSEASQKAKELKEFAKNIQLCTNDKLVEALFAKDINNPIDNLKSLISIESELIKNYNDLSKVPCLTEVDENLQNRQFRYRITELYRKAQEGLAIISASFSKSLVYLNLIKSGATGLGQVFASSKQEFEIELASKQLSNKAIEETLVGMLEPIIGGGVVEGNKQQVKAKKFAADLKDLKNLTQDELKDAATVRVDNIENLRDKYCPVQQVKA